MVGNVTIKDVVTAITCQSFFNTARISTTENLVLTVYNQTVEWICMIKPWRDLVVDASVSISTDNKITLPNDCGRVIRVYTDTSNIGMPTWDYELNNPDISRRYTEEVETDLTTGAKTRNLIFPSTTYIPVNPRLIYQKEVPVATQEEVEVGTKLAPFPMNLMVAVAKKILQDYYGATSNQDPNWINLRVQEELSMYQAYTYQNNARLNMVPKDNMGRQLYICGLTPDGEGERMMNPYPYPPSTMFTGV